ncbi:MAG: DUF6172 family protein, partial [Gallionella sp.]|nr:DUF6172 family protein [Gallionella sp.]
MKILDGPALARAILIGRIAIGRPDNRALANHRRSPPLAVISPHHRAPVHWPPHTIRGQLMRKTYQLNIEGKNRDRLLEAAKHDIRKYVKRERARALPEGVDFWDFDCKFGN